MNSPPPLPGTRIQPAPQVAQQAPATSQGWLVRFLDIKQRIHGYGNFPKIYRKGTDVVLSASGYLTPWRFIFWYYFRFVLVLAAVFLATGIGISWLLGNFPFYLAVLGIGGSFFAVFALVSPMHKSLARLLLGKKTVVELLSDRIKIYGNGYGLSFPKTIARNFSQPFSSLVEEHDYRTTSRIKAQGKTGIARNIEVVYASSFVVKIVYGDLVEQVAEVYMGQQAKDLAAGIMNAETARISMAEIQQQTARRERELPE